MGKDVPALPLMRNSATQALVLAADRIGEWMHVRTSSRARVCMQGVGVKGEGCVLCAFRVLRIVVGWV
jgi:hypothetical protein